ncbi:MAG TPA: MMPL family transporter [Methylomirabilota bacterium]|jgi:hopanoid biosynthesis associated RND transporter like protein HpnN
MRLVSTSGWLLRRLARVATGYPVWTLTLAVLLAGAGLAYALTTLTLATSQRDLLPRGQPYIQRYAEYSREFGQLDDIAIAVEAPSLAEAKQYATRLVRELRAREVPLKRIAYRIDPEQFQGRALLYLPLEHLGEIRERIFDNQELLEAFAARPTLDTLVHGISTQVASGFASGFLDLGLSEAKGPIDLRFIQDVAGQISERLDRLTTYRSPFGTLFAANDRNEARGGYFFSEDQRFLFILIEPISRAGSFTEDREAIEGIRTVIASLRLDFPDVQAGVTGKPALANDEMTAAFRDSERATLLAFGFVLALLLLAFRRVAKPFLLLLVLTVSLGWSIGAATLGIGHLSLFSVMFIPIVIGIGIDYAVYFLFRYEEESALGRGVRDAIEITAVRSGPGVLVAAVTAAGSFYVLMLTDFPGLQELGFIAGTAILFAWAAMTIVLPAALVIVDRRRSEPARPPASRPESVGVPWLDGITRHSGAVLALAGVVTVLSLWGTRSLHFDYNLLNLQARGTESVAWERRIMQSAHRSGFAALAGAGSLEELREKRDAFTKLPSVSGVDSALLLVPSDQPQKFKIIHDFASVVGPIQVGRPTAVDATRLATELTSLKRRLDMAATEAPAGEAKTKLAGTTDELGQLIGKLRRMDPVTSRPILDGFQNQVYQDFRDKFQLLQANLTPGPVGLADVPPEIKGKFVSDRGHFLLQIHPAVDIWEREDARRFVNDLRQVDPEVTGTPIITYEVITLMQRAYKQGTLYALVLVTVISVVMLRRLRETALALLPLALGLTWMGGLMALFQLDFHMGNIFGLPLVIGVAVEYGVNIVIRHLEGADHAGGPLVGRSTVMGVLMAGLCNIAGFGSLMLADHRGIFGLGLLITLGTASSLLAALVVLPALLRVFRPRAVVGQAEAIPTGAIAAEE